MIACARIDQSKIQRGLAALGGDLEHVVHPWINTPLAQLFRSLGQTGNERLQFGRGWRADDRRFPVPQCGRGQLQHFRSANIRNLPELLHQLGDVHEPGEPRVQPVILLH